MLKFQTTTRSVGRVCDEIDRGNIAKPPSPNGGYGHSALAVEVFSAILNGLPLWQIVISFDAERYISGGFLLGLIYHSMRDEDLKICVDVAEDDTPCIVVADEERSPLIIPLPVVGDRFRLLDCCRELRNRGSLSAANCLERAATAINGYPLQILILNPPSYDMESQVSWLLGVAGRSHE